MKVSCLFFALNVIFFCGAQDVKSQQQLLNGGFEDVYQDTLTISSGVLKPHFWFFGWNPQDCVSFLGKLTDDSHSGNWAVELETVQCQWSINSGTLGTTSDFTDTDYISETLYEINARPDQLSYYYKYNPVDGDTAQISILLFNYPDSVTFMDPNWFTYWDTIAYGEQKIIEETGNYSLSLVNIEYYSDEVPQFVAVRAYTNHKGNAILDNLSHVHAGTTLWIDDVELIYLNTSVGEWSDSGFNIFPNPVIDRFQLNQAEDVTAKSMELLNHVGQSVGTLNPQDRFHAVAHLPPGMYFLQIETEKGVVVKKMVKE